MPPPSASALLPAFVSLPRPVGASAPRLPSSAGLPGFRAFGFQVSGLGMWKASGLGFRVYSGLGFGFWGVLVSGVLGLGLRV